MRSMPFDIVMPNKPKIYAKTCGQCKCAKDMLPGTQNAGGKDARLCKRFPPQVTSFVVNNNQIASQSSWPTVNIHWEACEEYKPKLLESDERMN